jgi:hypothetical protein
LEDDIRGDSVGIRDFFAEVFEHVKEDGVVEGFIVQEELFIFSGGSVVGFVEG